MEVAVVSATEVEVGLAGELVSVLVGVVAESSEDVVAAAGVVAAAAALVLSAEVMLLDIVKT